MLALTIWTGALLVATGVIAYIVTDFVSVTALIPAFIGVLLLIAALVGRRSGKVSKYANYTSLAIALLGALGALMNVVKIGDLIAGTAERPSAIVTSLIMFVVLVAYLAAGVRYVVKAHAARP